MPIFKKQKILFIHNPKTGGSSIEDYFYKKFNVQRTADTLWMINHYGHASQHCTYVEVKKLFPNIDFNQYKVLGVVRNPYHRMISELLYIKVINVQTSPKQVTEHIRKYLNNDVTTYGNHKLEQYKYYIDDDGNIAKNIIIMRQESLSEEMNKLGYSDFNIRSNVTNKNNCDYSKFYNLESQKLVYEYYRRDFEIFGYDPNLKCDVKIIQSPIIEHKRTNFEAAKKFIKYRRSINEESLSGPGSFLKNSKKTIELVNETINKFQIKSILDLGCGDFNWGRYLKLDNVNYIGWDCDQKLINDINNLHGKKNVNFFVKDVVIDDYPDVDMIICRDILFSMKLDIAITVIEKCKSKCKYFISTTFNDTKQNTGPMKYLDIDNWGFYKINLDIDPFLMESQKIKQYRDENGKFISLYTFTENINHEISITKEDSKNEGEMFPRKAYILYIDRSLSLERATNCAKSCENVGMKYELFKGYQDNRGKELWDKVRNDIGLDFKVTWNGTKGEECCYASHISMWAKIRDNKECAIIMEHDFYLYHPVNIAIPDLTICNMGYKVVDKNDYNYQIAGPPTKMRKILQQAGSHGYAITWKTADFLLKEIEKRGVKLSIDQSIFMRYAAYNQKLEWGLRENPPHMESGVPLTILDPIAGVAWTVNDDSTVERLPNSNSVKNINPIKSFNDNWNQRTSFKQKNNYSKYGKK
jgi:GR25 family glycosyltransferase involved in LPS biosynthesis/2-polyprenyl-3-methyl-5-hydroxy-6-metoxy-1,4-benzoquinol methylase